MKLQCYGSILFTKSKINTCISFSFREIETDNVDKEGLTWKAGTQNDISGKILKKCKSSTAPICKKFSTKKLRTGNFPDTLKLADVITIFKKNNLLRKENYKPVTVLPVVSKIFERTLQKQKFILFTRKTFISVPLRL